jgi:hypothetical protein
MDGILPEEVFDKARKLYPGTRRGNETEFANFKKKHKDWKEVLPLLFPAIEKQIKWKETARANGLRFVRLWKIFQTWINQRCWEEEPDEEIVKIMNKVVAKQEVRDKVQTEESYLVYTLKCIQHEDSSMVGRTRNTWLKPPKLEGDELLAYAEKGRRAWETIRGGKWTITLSQSIPLPENCFK